MGITPLYYLDLCNIKSLQNRLPLSSAVVLTKCTVTGLLNRHFYTPLLVLTSCSFSYAFVVNTTTDYSNKKKQTQKLQWDDIMANIDPLFSICDCPLQHFPSSVPQGPALYPVRHKWGKTNWNTLTKGNWKGDMGESVITALNHMLQLFALCQDKQKMSHDFTNHNPRSFFLSLPASKYWFITYPAPV